MFVSIHCRLSLNSCFYVNKMKVRGKGNIIQPSQPRLKKTDFSIRDSAEHIMFTQSSSRYKDRIYCMLFQFDVKNGFIINNNLYAGECCRFLFFVYTDYADSIWRPPRQSSIILLMSKCCLGLKTHYYVILYGTLSL